MHTSSLRESEEKVSNLKKGSELEKGRKSRGRKREIVGEGNRENIERRTENREIERERPN